jgi:poly(3-hydroxyalkanoate) synthetase
MRATTCPPGIVNAGADSLFAVYESTVRGTVDFWTGALERGASPLDIAGDVVLWAGTAVRRERPQWATEHEIVHEWPLVRLRDFSDHAGPDMVPTLVFPPQAGHSSCIVDYAPDQSQMRTARQAGITRLFALDWRGATHATRDADVEDYLDVVSEAIDRIGGRANLVGDCQGGWLATIYAALHPEHVHSLTIAGAPVDFHAGEPLIHDWIQLLSPTGELAMYKAAVIANGGVLPGDFLLNGFKGLQPEAELDRQLQLLARVHEPEHVQRYRTFETWFQHTQPIPGGFYLWIVRHLFQRNELVAGTLQVRGAPVDLGRITCPLYLLAGGTDHITPPPQVFALADYAGTPLADIVRLTTTGGHLGLFMGHEALREHWSPVFHRIAQRSRPDVVLHGREPDGSDGVMP